MREHSAVLVAWKNMRARCNNPNNTEYAAYGGRGIRVCEAWDASFEAFARDMGPRPDGYSIERNNVNGNYEPTNCRWATASEQARNRRHNATVTLAGVTRTVAEWETITGVKAATLYARLHRGLPPEQILAVEDYRRPVVLKYQGQTHSLRDWATLTGVRFKTLHSRLAAGWPVDQVLERT